MVNGLSDLVGKHLLFTLVVCNRDGEVTKRRQYHGTVEDDGGEPILRPQGSDERIPLPPMYDQIVKTEPQQTIELEESGEKIGGVEYTLTCVKSPP